jgi:hypothetical protein
LIAKPQWLGFFVGSKSRQPVDGPGVWTKQHVGIIRKKKTRQRLAINQANKSLLAGLVSKKH